ncbi:hypothetical protein [Nonomuraea sp. NEAU-A123]|uniref:hypothetical protein n=1 Tax=Nonomuraea sp. NEAU-A123 TaxID=2839649 RepID=UPI001BE41944|nr:hypothetical protein [Nonomuraea sp. NEAU-A123]MBT2231249.1 hypothetical protein [Nonomuraea sp. NEAU-A123]
MSIRLLLAVPVLALALTACGAKAGEGDVASASGSTTSPAASASASTDRRAAGLKFAQCMREHGVDMPDPEPNGPVAIQQRPGDEQKVQKAQEACKQFMQAAVGEKGKGLDPQKQDLLVKFAQCMRQHGIDMPDPAADGRIEINIKEGTPEEKVKEAQTACKQFAGDLPLPR